MAYSVRRDISFTGQLTLNSRGRARGNLSVMWIWHVTPPGPPPTVVDTVNFERL
jgi:hypothetical protein